MCVCVLAYYFLHTYSMERTSNDRSRSWTFTLLFKGKEDRFFWQSCQIASANLITLLNIQQQAVAFHLDSLLSSSALLPLQIPSLRRGWCCTLSKSLTKLKAQLIIPPLKKSDIDKQHFWYTITKVTWKIGNYIDVWCALEHYVWSSLRKIGTVVEVFI